MKKIIDKYDVMDAAKASRIVLVNEFTIITPLAQDLAKELGVEFVRDNDIPSETDGVIDEIEKNPVKTVALGADHGGFAMKEELKEYIKKMGYTIKDVGTHNGNPCDYPDFALAVAELVAKNAAQRGIMIDSVGIGSAMAANKIKGVLAAKCNNGFEARSSREHNYANVLALGAKVIGGEIAKEIVKIFLETQGGAERHKKRVNKILQYKQIPQKRK